MPTRNRLETKVTLDDLRVVAVLTLMVHANAMHTANIVHLGTHHALFLAAHVTLLTTRVVRTATTLLTCGKGTDHAVAHEEDSFLLRLEPRQYIERLRVSQIVRRSVHHVLVRRNSFLHAQKLAVHLVPLQVVGFVDRNPVVGVKVVNVKLTTRLAQQHVLPQFRKRTLTRIHPQVAALRPATPRELRETIRQRVELGQRHRDTGGDVRDVRGVEGT